MPNSTIVLRCVVIHFGVQQGVVGWCRSTQLAHVIGCQCIEPIHWHLVCLACGQVVLHLSHLHFKRCNTSLGLGQSLLGSLKSLHKQTALGAIGEGHVDRVSSKITGHWFYYI